MSWTTSYDEKYRCTTCNQYIENREYKSHVENCQQSNNSIKEKKRTNFSNSNSSDTRRRKTKECPVCCAMVDVDDFYEHIDDCGIQTPFTYPIEPIIEKNTGDCPICYKEFPIDDLPQHASTCADNFSRSTSKTCFTCSTLIDSSKASNSTILCPFKHTYCFACLQEAMNEYINSNTSPVCNFGICNYELSQYDIYCLPFDSRMIDRLLSLVKTTKRPKCSLCSFYVQIDTKDDFEKHTAACSRDNVSCQYCNCLIPMHQYDNHEQQCRRSERFERLQAFYNFILSRTKYPITIQQLRFFLEKRREDHLSNDAHDVVNALDTFEGIFPYEIPTRVCDICAESFVYDDRFVVDCDESHKLCYDCFADATANQMKENQILKCAMCSYQLADGEIKQLRIPIEEKEKYLEYQSQRTFNKYAGSQGVLKCPNKDCKWIVELENPNSRFRVICPLCEYEFCSLCSQQYHYRTPCQQLPELTQRWFFWCNTERGNHWQMRARQDATYQTQLEDYERQRAANEQRNNELRQRYNELLADEQYKAQHCRLCPHCGRVVQRLEGCDSMICGQNYHGGDKQSGCGKGFNWASAGHYIAMANQGPRQVGDHLRAPKQDLVVHEGVQCDACHNEVYGIRFDCIHCPSLIFCEKCEQRATLEHSNDIRTQNKPQHIFQVITTV